MTEETPPLFSEHTRAQRPALPSLPSFFRDRLRVCTVEHPAQSVRNCECYREDGRKSLEELYRSYMRLVEDHGWEMEGLYTQVLGVPGGKGIPIPILSFRTPVPGPALWILSGIHGEEPAGPNAIAEHIELFADLGRRGVPMVVMPLCNPKGYSLNWRFPNTADRKYKSEENPDGGVSVGDADHLLPDYWQDLTKARAERPSSPDADALTSSVLRLAGRHPPFLVLDHHEDELEGGAYVYGMGHPPSLAARVASEVLNCLGRPAMSLVSHGVTRFGEQIVKGQVWQPEGFRDGSIDELLWSESIVQDGVCGKGPGARAVLTVETPVFQTPLECRIASHAAVFRVLPKLWEMAQESDLL